jgi:MFS superfamily sulfate permease-like transporter
MVALVLLAGLVLMLLGWARQGQLAAFVSRPVLRGFAFALGLTIIIRQLPDALGIELSPGAGVDPLHLLLDAMRQAPHWHGPTLLVAVAAGALVFLFRRWPRMPGSMLVIVLAVVAAQMLDLPAMGVREVGAIELPSWRPSLPTLTLQQWLRASELCVGLVVLIFAESWGSMRSLALSSGDRLDANRELLALGACNIGSGLFQGLAVGAGFSATAANATAGATSRRAGAVALLAMLAILLLAAPWVHALPRPVLAVAVISALWHAVSLRPLMAVWRMNRDRALIVGAVLAVVMFGVLDGMLAAIGLSILAALRGFSKPVLHELGELRETRNYVHLVGQPDAHRQPGLLILRPEEPLFFASAEQVMSLAMALSAKAPEARTVVLSLEESGDLDSTALECLLEFDQQLQRHGRVLLLARAKQTVRALLMQCDPQGLGQGSRLFWSVADAVQAASPQAATNLPSRA